jgi:hypothetical protein
MVVAYRLRKFAVAESADAVPLMIWCRWFRTNTQAQDYAVADCKGQVLWIGNSAMSEDHTYDLKRFEIFE